MAKKEARKSTKKSQTQRVSVKQVRKIRFQPILECTLEAPGCNTFRTRPNVSRNFGRKLCKRQGQEESAKNNLTEDAGPSCFNIA